MDVNIGGVGWGGVGLVGGVRVDVNEKWKILRNSKKNFFFLGGGGSEGGGRGLGRGGGGWLGGQGGCEGRIKVFVKIKKKKIGGGGQVGGVGLVGWVG